MSSYAIGEPPSRWIPPAIASRRSRSSSSRSFRCLVSTADIRHTRNAALIVRSDLHASSMGTLADITLEDVVWADTVEALAGDSDPAAASVTLRMARASVGVNTRSPAAAAASSSSL